MSALAADAEHAEYVDRICGTTEPPATYAWHKGPPPFPWSEEWFIAETTYGDRVVLKALPKEWTYDFKTADDTYLKADKIKRWMQFPDTQFIPFVDPASLSREAALVEALEKVWSQIEDAQFDNIEDDEDLVLCTITAPQARAIRDALKPIAA